ncbi:MAG: hypothetical protein CSA35_00260 [Dethiosulfovibrio peptidovorans]|nr:MAG: hypothetical protein CSA35_00260 [Dethiosulfovibrio peptidovorans]
MKGFELQLKNCSLCGRAFFGTFDEMACKKCESRYRQLREKIRNYLWNHPGQKATLTSISQDLNIPLEIVKVFQKDPRFQGVFDENERAKRRTTFARQIEGRRRS